MNITLSKSQWLKIGKLAGWTDENNVEIAECDSCHKMLPLSELIIINNDDSYCADCADNMNSVAQK